MGKIPDRWLNYTPIGDRVSGTRLIAFKVPLSPSICETVEDDSTSLDVQKVLDTIPRLGLVIDLTNTNRYYNPQDFKTRGVKHIKIMVPGHVVPKSRLRKLFRDTVNNFLECNPDNDKLIGVHCTHGVNRTGYFICDYMVCDLRINPKDAIQRFHKARGHPIERENYINALYPNLSGKEQRESTVNIYSARRSRQKSFTNPRSTVENWRLPEYMHQRNLHRQRNSDTHGFRSSHSSGFRNTDTSGVRNSNTGGFRSTNTSDYRSSDTTGIKSSDTGGFRRTNTSGFRSSDATGVRSSDTGGFRSSNTSGFGSSDSSRFRSSDTSGFDRRGFGNNSWRNGNIETSSRHGFGRTSFLENRESTTTSRRDNVSRGPKIHIKFET